MLISYSDMIGNNLCYKFRGLVVGWDMQNTRFDVGMKNLLRGNN